MSEQKDDKFDGILLWEIQLLQHYDKFKRFFLNNGEHIDLYNLLIGEEYKMCEHYHVKIVKYSDLNSSLIFTQNQENFEELIEMLGECCQFRDETPARKEESLEDFDTERGLLNNSLQLPEDKTGEPDVSVEDVEANQVPHSLSKSKHITKPVSF